MSEAPPNDSAKETLPNPYIEIKIPKRAFFIFTALAIILLGAEGIHRIKTHFKLQRRLKRNVKRYSMEAITETGVKLADSKGDIVVVHDPLLIYRCKANQKADYFTINKQGFRGPDWKKEKKSGLKRVIIIGSSVVFGHRLDNDELLFSKVLEERLKTKYPKQTIEVYNAGVIGYLACQDFTLLTSKLLDYKPDLIVLFNGWNDFFAGSQIKGKPSKIWFFNEIEKSLTNANTPNWNPLKLSSIYRSIERQFKKSNLSSKKTSQFEYNPKALESYLHYLKLTVQLARANSIKVLIAPQPELTMRKMANPNLEPEIKAETYWPGYTKHAQSEYSNFLKSAKKTAKDLSVPFFDSTVFIQSHEEETFFADPVHMSAAGHRRCAEALEKPVAKLLGLR